MVRLVHTFWSRWRFLRIAPLKQLNTVETSGESAPADSDFIGVLYAIAGFVLFQPGTEASGRQTGKFVVGTLALVHLVQIVGTDPAVRTELDVPL